MGSYGTEVGTLILKGLTDMRYDIKLLEGGLREVKKERDNIVSRSFPYLHQEEIDKVDEIIDQINNSINVLKNGTHEKR